MANFFDRFDAPAAVPAVAPQKEDQQRNFFDQFDEAQPPAQPVAEGKPASVIPQLPVAPVTSTVPEDEGFLARNYRYAKDALISGYESFRANTKGEAFAISRGAMLKDEEEYGGPGVPLAPPEVRERYERNKREAGQYAQDIAGFQKEAQERQLASPLRPETARLKAAMGDDLTFMESAKEAGAALFSNPVGVIADLGAESLPAMAYMVSTALVGRLAAQNPTAAAQAGGLGSAATQFGNEYVDRLQKGESHDEAWKNASIRSGVIGVFDAMSLKTAGSAAGKIVEALKTGKPASVAAKEFIKEVGTQAGLGGAGEAAGSLAIGEVPNPAAVIAEMAGETVTGPFEAIGTYQRVKGIEKLSREDKAIADLDKLAADEEAEAATSGLVSEEDLFAEEAAGRIPAAETVPATLEELKKIDKDLKKKLGRAPTTDEVEKALNDFEQEKTRRLRAESGGRKPPVSVPSGEEAAAGVTGAPARTEPTGLGEGVGAAASVGAREEPTLAALKPEDTAVYANIRQPTGSSSEGNVALQNYFKTYYGLPAKSLPKAAGALMPALERAETLLQRYFETYNQSNLPFLGTGPWNQGKRNANRPPEYVEADRYMPSGEIRRLANAALAIDKKYKTKGNNPERFASEIAQFEERLNNFEEALNSLPPPLTDEERQVREADYNAKNPTPDYDVVPKERQLQSLVNLLRKGIYTPAKADPTKLQEAVAAGLITQEEVDTLQRQSEGLLAEEPTAPTEEAAGPSVSAMQAEIDALKAAGAEVPTFEAPSTAAAKREAKAKKERSKAIAKMAVELGGTADEDISLQDIDTSAVPTVTQEEIDDGIRNSKNEIIEELAALGRERATLVAKVRNYGSDIETQRLLNELDALTKNLRTALRAYNDPIVSAENFLNHGRNAMDGTGVFREPAISPEVFEVIQAVYKKFPKILEGLRLSIKSSGIGQRNIAGMYFPLEKIVRLFTGTKGAYDAATIRHELMHSLEQMMTKEAKEAVINAWHKAFQKAIKQHKDPKSQKFFHKVLDFLDNPNNESLAVAIRAMPSYDFYQYVNPSEFWAVNAEKLFAAKLGGGWEQFKSAIRKLFEALKDTFGFDNNYAVHKTLDGLLKGEAPRGGSDITSYLLSGKGVDFLANVGDLDAELEQKAIELSLKVGDIHPTIVSAISNNDLNGALRIAASRLTGFSADLAKALLDLKLPTNISFNSGRDLVRRSIDNVSRAEQGRLFRYVQMHYPQVYDKYFKNYDRFESLEAVSEGLAELQKPNYKLGPVIAEFETVLGAYKKYIEGLTAPGAYYPEFDEIALDANTRTGKSYRVFLHEVVHAATEYVLDTFGRRPQDLTPGQRAAAEELTKMYNYAVEKLGKTPYGMTNIYEFVAEVFTNKKFQDLLKGLKYEPKKTPFLSRLVKAILRAFGLDNLAGNAMAEATKIFSAVRTGVPLARGPRFAKGGPKGPRIRGPISTPQTWRTAESQSTSLIRVFNDALKGRMSWDEALKIISPSMWDSNTGRFRRAVLGFLNLRQIDDLTKTKFPQISGAIRIIEQMLAYRGSVMKSAEDIVTDWTKAQAKKPKQGQLLSRIMIEATLRGLDPDKPGTKAMNAALVQAWNQLDPEFKQIYRQVRDFYANSVNSMVREMKSRIANSDKPLSEKKAAIREINNKFGPDKLVQPYFPLRRFGKFWFQVGSGNFKEFYEFESEKDREVAMRLRERELRKGNAQQQALADTIRKGNGLSELFTQNMTTTQVLKEAEDIIDNVTATTVGDAKKEMKDSLNQLIYILLPQQSMRKMFINRKGVQGASADMIRVFATSAVHSAYQQSRFRFAEKFINNLNSAREYVDPKYGFPRDRAAVYQDYIQEVERRVPYILSNEDTSLGAKVAGKASELTFFYMLSAPFSAMLNVLGVAQITMPYIGSRYGYAKTNALMIKNFGRYLATSPSRTFMPLAKGNIMQAQFPSIAEGGRLTGVLKQAADRFIEEGQINISLTNDLMDMGERPSELYTGRYNMVKKMLSGLFHQSERLGREVSLLTTFELAYDKFSKSPKKDLRGVIERDAQGEPVMNTPEEAFELAIVEAKDIVGLSLGDFTRQMKPRHFVSPLMSVLTKFKQYSVLATYAVIRNFYFTVAAPFRKKEIEEFRQLMLKEKMSPEVIEQRLAEAEAQRKELYREGRRRLAGILAVTYLLGGNEASPFYSIGIGPLVKMLADEDDDEFFDWENWLKNYMEEELGGAAGDFFAEMGMDPKNADKAGRFVGGSLQRGVVSEITGGDLAGRVSLDPKNLWYREGRYSPDTRESLLEEIVANAGPVVGLGVNWVESYRLFQEGQYQRAFEKAAPALISKPVAAERISDEGAKTASGIKLVDNFSAWELAMLSIGLQPTRLAQAQKSAIEAKEYTEKIKDRRNTLLNRLWMERDNPDGFNETLEKIVEFSTKYPNYEITPENIQESFDRRGENQAQAEAIGGQFDKKSIPDALQMLRYGRE